MLKTNRMAAVVFSALLGAGVLLATAAPASADYGKGEVYQVEISAGTQFGGGVGGGIWLWVGLNQDHTADYSGSDCVHRLNGVPTGSTADRGDTTWQDNGDGTLTIFNVSTGAGPENITVSSTFGHYRYPSTTLPPLFSSPPFSELPAIVQVAP